MEHESAPVPKVTPSGANNAKVDGPGPHNSVPVEMDASLPADVFEACAMISIKAGCDYPSYVPTGLIDPSMVSAQVVSCSDTLAFADVTSNVLGHVDKLKIGLEKYTGAVSQIMKHLTSISSSAKLDFDKVCEARLLENFGLPSSQGESLVEEMKNG